jgi:hypothetical protein
MLKIATDLTITTDRILAVLGILVGAFIAYHLYFLQKRISFSAKMRSIEKVRNKVNDELLDNNHRNVSSEVIIVNTLRYKNGYEGDNNLSLRRGYMEQRVAMKAGRYDGVEFFEAMQRQAYYDKKGRLTLKHTDNEAFGVYTVGFVPYGWIEFVDWRGDEFYSVPLFFVKYRGLFREPFKQYRYYKRSDMADDGDRADHHYELVKVRTPWKIKKLFNLLRTRLRRR